MTLNWLTWSDHYFPKQLQQVQKATGIGGRPQLFSDDSDSYVKVKAGGGGWDMSSEDALWVPKFYKEGLIVAVRHQDRSRSSKQLYPVALDVPFWKAGYQPDGLPVRLVEPADLLQPEVRHDEAGLAITRCSTRRTRRRSCSRTSRPT